MDFTGLTARLDNPDTLVMLAIFGAAFFVFMGTANILVFRGSVQRRLHGAADEAPAEDRPTVRLQTTGRAEKLLGPLRKYFVPGDDETISSVRVRIIRAGYMTPSAVRSYFALRALLGLTLAIAIGLLAPMLSKAMSLQWLVALSLVVALIGFYLPSLWISLRIRSRQEACRDDFPDALDMLLICVEAGLGMDAAINRVSEEISRAHPILAEHFALMGLELRAGKSREDALRNFSMRIGIDEVAALVTLLLQSEMLGTSVSQSLRVYATDMRARRLLRAEEKAGKVPVLLSIPLILCILPSLMTVVMAPAAIRVFRNLLPVMGGD